MVTIIACEVMREELLKIATHEQLEFRFVSMGLHRWPERLKEELARILAEEVPAGTTAIVFGFGLCGGRFRPSPGLSVAFFGHRGLDEANAY